MENNDLALVMGGGGAAGNAWLIGIIAGLAEAGFDLTQAADLVIGTSAGATAAVQVRSGLAPADLMQGALALPPQRPAASGAGGSDGAGNAPRRPEPAVENLFQRMREIGAAARDADDLQRRMGALALEQDTGLGPEAGVRRRAVVAGRLPRTDWPERPMIIVAVNAETGALAAFDRHSGADLVDAVTASTALPGATPSQPINGGRYIDGGVRSTDNADLAAGFGRVVVLVPLGGRPPGEGQFEGLRRFPGADLDSQVAALQAGGSRVAVILPDAESRAAMGDNVMDLRNRPPSARAGFVQGQREAARLLAL